MLNSHLSGVPFSAPGAVVQVINTWPSRIWIRRTAPTVHIAITSRSRAGAAVRVGLGKEGERHRLYDQRAMPSLQCDETNSTSGNAGGMAKFALMRLASAAGVKPNCLRNSRLNCEGLV